MEDQTSWKGHTFTLLVFTGIVVLCSIFFILGMLVGRAQGQKVAFAASASAAAKSDAKDVSTEENKPELTFYDSVKQSETSYEPTAPLKTEPVAPDPPKPAEVERRSATAPPSHGLETVFNYQIGAVRKSGDAEKLLDQVRKKGFKAFILAPASSDANPFFRVQVGPFASSAEAVEAKKKLESAGYQPILKK